MGREIEDKDIVEVVKDSIDLILVANNYCLEDSPNTASRYLCEVYGKLNVLQALLGK